MRGSLELAILNKVPQGKKIPLYYGLACEKRCVEKENRIEYFPSNRVKEKTAICAKP